MLGLGLRVVGVYSHHWLLAGFRAFASHLVGQTCIMWLAGLTTLPHSASLEYQLSVAPVCFASLDTECVLKGSSVVTMCEKGLNLAGNSLLRCFKVDASKASVIEIEHGMLDQGSWPETSWYDL